MKDNKDYISTIQAAKELNVSVRTIQQWVDSGNLTAWVSPGGHRRIDRESVAALLLQRTTGQRQEPSGRKSILVVEDDKDLLLLYKMNMRKWQLPVDVRFAENGYLALVEIGRACPDLLITDLSMPDIDGFKMLECLEEANIHFPTIVVTGLPKSEVDRLQERSRDLLILTKPVDFDLLRRLIFTTLDLRRLGSEAAA